MYTVIEVSDCVLCVLLHREEEIIMPDEHTGVVRENYLWKVRFSFYFNDQLKVYFGNKKAAVSSVKSPLCFLMYNS